MLCGLIAMLGAWDDRAHILYFATGLCALIILGVFLPRVSLNIFAPMFFVSRFTLTRFVGYSVPEHTLRWSRCANQLGVPPPLSYGPALKATLACLRTGEVLPFLFFPSLFPSSPTLFWR